MKKRFVFRGILLLLILSGVWSLYSSRYRLEVTHYQISSARLPEPFDGYRIVQLSDLHAARFGDEDENLVEQVAQLEPDMIAMTGDYIEKKEHIPQVQHLVETLTQIAQSIFPAATTTGPAAMPLPCARPLSRPAAFGSATITGASSAMGRR